MPSLRMATMAEYTTKSAQWPDAAATVSHDEGRPYVQWHIDPHHYTGPLYAAQPKPAEPSAGALPELRIVAAVQARVPQEPWITRLLDRLASVTGAERAAVGYFSDNPSMAVLRFGARVPQESALREAI